VLVGVAHSVLGERYILIRLFKREGLPKLFGGTEFTTRTTWGKPGDTLALDIDPKSHPAWTGGQQNLLDRGGRVSRFQKKFAGIGAKK